MRDVEFSMLLLQLFSKSKMSSNECLKKTRTFICTGWSPVGFLTIIITTQVG